MLLCWSMRQIIVSCCRQSESAPYPIPAIKRKIHFLIIVLCFSKTNKNKKIPELSLPHILNESIQVLYLQIFFHASLWNFLRRKCGGPSYSIIIFCLKKVICTQRTCQSEENSKQTANSGHPMIQCTRNISTLRCYFSTLGSWLLMLSYTPLHTQACLCHMSSKTPCMKMDWAA